MTAPAPDLTQYAAVPVDLLQRVFNQLVQRPYYEVADLVTELSQLQTVDDYLPSASPST